MSHFAITCSTYMYMCHVELHFGKRRDDWNPIIRAGACLPTGLALTLDTLVLSGSHNSHRPNLWTRGS